MLVEPVLVSDAKAAGGCAVYVRCFAKVLESAAWSAAVEPMMREILGLWAVPQNSARWKLRSR